MSPGGGDPVNTAAGETGGKGAGVSEARTLAMLSHAANKTTKKANALVTEIFRLMRGLCFWILG